MKVIIFAYNRPRALLELLYELEGMDVTVIDDNSGYDPSEHLRYCDYIRTEPRRKHQFYKQWQLAFDICRNSTHEYFLFLPDDFYSINLTALRKVKQYAPFALHLVNFGTKKMWTGINPSDATFHGLDCERIGFVDCSFFTNRLTLELMEWKQPEVKWDWFARSDMSSGVGATQSRLLEILEIPIYRPKRPLASHGKWDSVMHPEHRKLIPLVC